MNVHNLLQAVSKPWTCNKETLEGLVLPLEARQGLEVTLLFVSTACPVCRSLHGTYAELIATDTAEKWTLVFPMDNLQVVEDYTNTHQIPGSRCLTDPQVATRCTVTKTPTLVCLQYSDDNWRLMLRQPIDRAQQLARCLPKRQQRALPLRF